jgi:ankyrin repeat protein
MDSPTLAVRSRNCEVVQVLIQAFEDPEDRRHYVNVPEINGWTALHLATTRVGDRKVVQALIEAIDSPKDRECYVRMPESRGWTALHLAATVGSRVIVQDLLEVIKDPEDRKEYLKLTDKSRSTALHLVMKLGTIEVVRTLIQVFKDQEDRKNYVNLMNKDQSTALQLAFTHKLHIKSRPVIKLLVDGGAKLDLADGNGYVALHYACESGDLELVKYIYKLNRSMITRPAGAKCSKRTCLQIAVVAGKYDVVTWLLHKLNLEGIKSKDGEGKTAWELACSTKNHRQRFEMIAIFALKDQEHNRMSQSLKELEQFRRWEGIGSEYDLLFRLNNVMSPPSMVIDFDVLIFTETWNFCKVSSIRI